MSEVTHFTPELFELLRQLKRHNNRDWFRRNKARYEQLVRDPALLFITAAIPRLLRLSKTVSMNPPLLRGSLFRIYRDIRFSSDKRPFKTHVGIQFSHATTKDAHAPCYYLHLEPDSCFVAAGVWHPDASALLQIRNAIVSNPRHWKRVRRTLELRGDRLVRPPRGFDPAHPFIEDLKSKDFITSLDLRESEVCHPRFIQDFVDACRKMTPLVAFTAKAMEVELRATEGIRSVAAPRRRKADLAIAGAGSDGFRGRG